MDTTAFQNGTSPFKPDRSPSDLTLVEVAEQLERVTGWIEAERVREREARAAYEAVRDQTEANIARVREYARALVTQQRTRMNSFDGILGVTHEPRGSSTTGLKRPGPVATSTPKTIADAIVAVWSPNRSGAPLSTEEIAEALIDVGYRTNAAPASIKSSVNQALAKLCKVGRIVRLRADGSVIPARDKSSRARKYLAANRLPEGQIVG